MNIDEISNKKNDVRSPVRQTRISVKINKIPDIGKKYLFLENKYIPIPKIRGNNLTRQDPISKLSFITKLILSPGEKIPNKFTSKKYWQYPSINANEYEKKATKKKYLIKLRLLSNKNQMISAKKENRK